MEENKMSFTCFRCNTFYNDFSQENVTRKCSSCGWPIDQAIDVDDVSEDEEMYTECLNCGSIWGEGSEEWEWQQCDACGWSPGDPTDEDSDFDDDDHDYEPIS